ncbi:MAG: hypothetical protein K2N87_05510 [Eubacterium sp.]|nr:hypothetical protein [Eubacterium sp.]
MLGKIDESELVCKKNEYKEKGITLHVQRRVKKEIVTLHGKLSFSRVILRPFGSESKKLLLDTEGIKSVAPLDCYLGIDRIPFKMSVDMILECAYWAQNQCSFEAAQTAVKKIHGIDINDDTIRLATDYIGRMIFENDCRKASTAWEKFNTAQLRFPYDRKGILYIEMDGAALNTRHKNGDGSTWRENKLGIVFSSDNIYHWTGKDGKPCRMLQKREYISYIGESCEFKKHLLACALRNGYGRYRDTVILSDGASWIAHIAEEMYPDAQHILDFFHLAENVHDFARAKYGTDESEYKSWAKEICDKLENGRWEEVLAALNPDETYPNTVNLYHYIESNREHINYPEYKTKGYFIGSGAIESGNKVVLQKRLKLAGMRWNPKTAQYIITLVSKEASKKWNEDVVDFVLSSYNQLF